MIVNKTAKTVKNHSPIQKTTIRIRTINDEEHTFSMQAVADGEANLTIAAKVERLLNRRSFAVEVDNHLLIIPLNQIRTIEVGPLQNHIPENIVPRVEWVK